MAVSPQVYLHSVGCANLLGLKISVLCFPINFSSIVYMALSLVSKDACFIQSLLSGFVPALPPVILSENKAAVYIAKNCGMCKEYCHID
mgnify:CR=1 FL=1